MTSGDDLDPDGDFYASFLTTLLGLMDDAQLSGYSREGLTHLSAAREYFAKELLERHPDYWNKAKPGRI